MTLLPVLTGGRGAPRALGLILSPSPGGGCLASQRLPFIPLPSSPSQGPRAAGPKDPQEGIVPYPPPPSPAPEGSTVNSEDLSGFKLPCGPPRWKDRAACAEAFETPATHHVCHSEASE